MHIVKANIVMVLIGGACQPQTREMQLMQLRQLLKITYQCIPPINASR